MTPTNKVAAKRLSNIYPDLKQNYLSRCYLLSKIAEKGFSISNYLREKQMAQLDALAEVNGKKPRNTTFNKFSTKKPEVPKVPKPKTWEVSLALYMAGKTPSEIARERSLTVGTVFSHLARYISSGKVSLDALVSPEKQQMIRRVLSKVGENDSVSAIKTLCPADVTYDEIRLMMKLHS